MYLNPMEVEKSGEFINITVDKYSIYVYWRV